MLRLDETSSWIVKTYLKEKKKVVFDCYTVIVVIFEKNFYCYCSGMRGFKSLKKSKITGIGTDYQHDWFNLIELYNHLRDKNILISLFLSFHYFLYKHTFYYDSLTIASYNNKQNLTGLFLRLS